MLDFVSFNNHTTFSLMQSLIEPASLFKKAKELGQSAIAVTDYSTLAGAWDSLKFSKEAGVKLIIGCEFYFVDDLSIKEGRLRHIILCAKNAIGYKNLLLANKLANDNHIIGFKKVIPRIDWKLLELVHEGLICTTACGSGILSQLFNTRRADDAKIQAKRLKDIFGDNLALEIQPHAMKRNANLYNDYEDQGSVNRQLIKLGDELDIKVIPTFDSHYLTKDQWEAHDTLLAIGAGQPIKSGARLKYDNEFYLRTRDEVRDFFARLYPTKTEQFCDNTLYFADKCEIPEWIDPKFSNPSGKELPVFHVHKQPDLKEFKYWMEKHPELLEKTEDSNYLRFLLDKNFKCEPGKEEEYRNRIEKELEVLEMKDLCSYMLIVADYVNWAKKNDIPTGTGRGSAAGCYVAYLLGIHDADSIKYGLLFERFYNKAKTGLSDIDCDFGQEGKPLVEKYVIDTYGQNYCAQVSNFSTLTPKPYVKAIARAFMFGGDQKEAVKIGAAIADIIPKEIHSVVEAFETVPLLGEYAVRYPQLKNFAKLIGNKPYNFATHAGAIIIGKRPLTEIVPLRCTKDGDIAIEYEKERAEANGLAKMDLLGLSNLDIIKSTISLIKQNGKIPPSIPWDYDKNDIKTYDLISSGDNFGVFQLGKSGSTVELCKKIKPKNILDLAIINALARPGVPKDVREKFIEAKILNKEVAVFHPSLKKAFAETLGFALYDEVLLQLGQDVAGWDLNEADRLRKFVKDKGKYPEKDKKLKKDFIDGAVKNRIPQDIAAKIWNDIVGNFGSYAFNKSHAVVYSFLSYQTAYLKAHFPLEFLVSNLNFYSNSNSLDAKDNILKAKGEVRKLNIKILPPDINKSLNEYKIIDRDTLLTGLKSLKFIGKDAIPEIIAKRPFKSFEHFLSSVDGRKVKAPAVQALAASGCLDSFGLSRKLMFLYAADYKTKLSVWLKNNRESGKTFNYPWPKDVGEWTIPEQNAMEISYLGEGLTGTVYQVYPGFFDNRALNFTKLPSLFPEPPKDAKKEDQQCVVSSSWGTIEGIVKTSFEFKVKKEDSKIFGETMARVIIQDPFGNSAGMTIFPKKLKHFQERLKELKGSKVKIEPGAVIHIAGSINWYEGEISILFDDLKKCEPPPIAPIDLKRQKVSMKITGGSKKRGSKIDPDEILSEVEDELIEEGLAESSSLDDDLFEKENFVDHLEDFV